MLVSMPTSQRAGLEGRRPEGEVEALTWPRFTARFQKMWEPGQHLSCIAPAGAGKSTLISALLNLRLYVLALDPKGGDETISALGYKRLATWPGEKKMSEMVARNDADNKPSRYIVGPLVRRSEEMGKLRKACSDALRDAFNMGGWTVYVDELQVLSDRRMMNLSGHAARLLVAARSKGITFVSSFQAPSWVPSEAMRQPTWVAIGYTRDTDTVNRLAEIMGRPKAEIRGAVKALPKFHWLIVGRDPRAPLIITSPPYLAPRKPR